MAKKSVVITNEDKSVIVMDEKSIGMQAVSYTHLARLDEIEKEEKAPQEKVEELKTLLFRK